MKRYLFLLLTLFCADSLFAQSLDSLFFEENIFETLNRTGVYGNKVTLIQPEMLQRAIQDQMTLNRAKKIQGYRIRIFSSNAQTARSSAQSVKEEFESTFPQYRAYPRFEPPDFRVVVGDFRTKSEAMRFHKELTARPQYRGAVIVRDGIEFPPL